MNAGATVAQKVTVMAASREEATREERMEDMLRRMGELFVEGGV